MNTESTRMPDFTPRLYALGLLVSGIVLAGLWLMSAFIAADYARDVAHWRTTLNMIAQEEATSVNQWVQERFGALRTLAENPDFKQAVQKGPKGSPVLLPMLDVTSRRGGFTDALAVVGADDAIVASIPMNDAMRDAVLAHVKDAPAGLEYFSDLQKDSGGNLYAGFSQPMADGSRLVGLIPVSDNLYGLLKYPGAFSEPTLETILVRRVGNNIDLLSPMRTNQRPLEKPLAFDPGKNVESALAGQEGGFIASQKDYRDNTNVLATGRLILGTGWTMIVKVDRPSALGAGSAHRANMVMAMLGVMGLVIAMVLGLWWYAHSRRSMLMSAYFQELVDGAGQERTRRLEMNHQLVATLVKIVDARDPFAASHSQLVARLAKDVAIQMELDALSVDTASIAASLMNIGKIAVPRDLLTKKSILSESEKRTIRESMYASAELLSDIRFEGPVLEALRQWQEKWDGTGPLGIKGDAILLPARVIAVCNAFIGMVSPRSWRHAMAREAAEKFLREHCGTFFDTQVVEALSAYLATPHGKAWLKEMSESERAA